MNLKVTPSIIHHFSTIQDPRIERGKRHKLSDIFFISICAVICGADNWTAIERFGYAKESWFTEMLELENGIPSHDTFGDVFAVIDIEEFSECFSRWAYDLATFYSIDDIIAIDGKCLRRSIDTTSKKAAIYMVGAWSNKNQLVLGQEKVADKSNEITAIPKLLRKLELDGAVITLDAMGCQTKVANQIIAQGGNYFLSLKGNQGKLHEDVKYFFQEDGKNIPIGNIDYDGGHGRVETRTVRVISEMEWFRKEHSNWPDLKSIVAITAKRELKERTTEETRYFITSLDASNPKRLGDIARAHWGIENNLHWVLDQAFDEDSQRNRIGNSAANFAIIRHIALNLLKSEKTCKVGIKTKRLNAGWDNEYLLKVMLGQKDHATDIAKF
ncbi:MAG: ISAs1 family transposase [Alphaproteobacteria bacterium]|nr:ISAs1 family transposase [Candidatus Scalindua sp.]MCP4393149.1 ISAs1 family transposase [Alphaproteobacteria bacterium]